MAARRAFGAMTCCRPADPHRADRVALGIHNAEGSYVWTGWAGRYANGVPKLDSQWRAGRHRDIGAPNRGSLLIAIQ